MVSRTTRPYGVPNSPLAPTECTTGPNGYFKVSVDISSGTTFSECDYKLCTRYAYKVENTGSKSYQQDHALIEISADQVLLDIEALNASYELPSVLGDADSTTKMGLYDKHEYWVRFNARNQTVTFTLYVEGESEPTGKTVYVSSGRKINESCSIAAPGVGFTRSSVGAFSTAGRCLHVADVTAGPVYLSAPFASACTVDGGQVKFYFDNPSTEASGCTDVELAQMEGVSVSEVKYCGGLEPGCPQCVRVRHAGDNTCVQYTAETVGGNNRFQQCIDKDGYPCNWETSGCAARFNN